MTPPGGLSLLIHLAIVLFGVIHRWVLHWMWPNGKPGKQSVDKAVNSENHSASRSVQQAIAYSVVGAITLLLTASVVISVHAILKDSSNFSILERFIAADHAVLADSASAKNVPSVCNGVPELKNVPQTTSLVDYLKETGRDSSIEGRIEIAQSFGMKSYTTSSGDNIELLGRLLRDEAIRSGGSSCEIKRADSMEKSPI